MQSRGRWALPDGCSLCPLRQCQLTPLAGTAERAASGNGASGAAGASANWKSRPSGGRVPQGGRQREHRKRSPLRTRMPKRSSFGSASSTSKSMSRAKRCFSQASILRSSASCGQRLGGEEEEVGEERFLAFLLLGDADDVVEEADIVGDVVEVDHVVDLLLVAQRAALVLNPLVHQEAAEREDAAGDDQRLADAVARPAGRRRA